MILWPHLKFLWADNSFIIFSHTTTVESLLTMMLLYQCSHFCSLQAGFDLSQNLSSVQNNFVIPNKVDVKSFCPPKNILNTSTPQNGFATHTRLITILSCAWLLFKTHKPTETTLNLPSIAIIANPEFVFCRKYILFGCHTRTNVEHLWHIGRLGL